MDTNDLGANARMFRRFLRIFPVLALVALAACGVTPPDQRSPATQAEIDELTLGIMALGPDIDPAEAAHAAEIAYRYSYKLAIAYQIEDPPLVHNTKVNMGIKARGLCWHWAEDMERRLTAEGFETLKMHRAIANDANPLLIAHSTAIIARRGSGWESGMVLDPWRNGGELHWATVEDDTQYKWVERRVALEDRLRREGRLPEGAVIQ